MIENEIREINQWIAAMNNRLTIIETIINDDNYRETIETVRIIRRAIDGDDDLNVPPLYDTITEFRDSITKLNAYQLNLRFVIVGMIIMHLITLILAIIALIP